MIDLNAPIIPGKSAAGILLGSDVHYVLGSSQSSVEEQRLTDKLHLHDFGAVKVWSSNHVVSQIGVFFGYAGTLNSKIGIGTTIADVESMFGCQIEEDTEDNLIVPGSSGWCFETEEWSQNHIGKVDHGAHITAIFVFKPR